MGRAFVPEGDGHIAERKQSFKLCLTNTRHIYTTQSDDVIVLEYVNSISHTDSRGCFDVYMNNGRTLPVVDRDFKIDDDSPILNERVELLRALKAI
jgi:hypothetical protein